MEVKSFAQSHTADKRQGQSETQSHSDSALQTPGVLGVQWRGSPSSDWAQGKAREGRSEKASPESWPMPKLSCAGKK